VGRDWTQINGDGTVQDFAGYYEDGVVSMRCSELLGEGSMCTDDMVEDR
jgi:hypothetical protein